AAIRSQLITTSPVEKALLFDYPTRYELLDKIATLYGYESLLKPQLLPAPGKFLYSTAEKNGVWQGIYPYFISSINNHVPHPEPAALFEKISEGQIWRFVTPIFLHGDLLHLFFNMVWLLVIGTQMEMRLSTSRYLFFIIISAIISNTAQYLVSGCAFIGFSGVICAIAFFIRQRQLRTPWEGYQLSRPTFQFILFFIGILTVLSFISFVLEATTLRVFPIAIANTAHLTGAIVGSLLGRLHFFAWQENS
ncbi:MAG TPA: rhomboid family intramembrane serine protease, partial [Chlamydiales bacterium]|nr:rhomboid family intramembrane serine protease [Chlamydiales bacterium]